MGSPVHSKADAWVRKLSCTDHAPVQCCRKFSLFILAECQRQLPTGRIACRLAVADSGRSRMPAMMQHVHHMWIHDTTLARKPLVVSMALEGLGKENVNDHAKSFDEMQLSYVAFHLIGVVYMLTSKMGIVRTSPTGHGSHQRFLRTDRLSWKWFAQR